RLRDALVTTGAGFRIGLIHDVLDPDEYPQWPIERTMELYFGGHTDLIVCGHTHVECIKCYGDVLVINPGSPTFPHNDSAQPGTVAVLTLAENRGGTVTVYDLKTLEALPGLCVIF
ncbi:MAG: metallophosphoesterase family protein, partial [Candidatus Binatia bacterium]